MAKKLLLDVLVKVLGEYIELNSDNLNLNLAVWSGNIALKNLKVRRMNLCLNYSSYSYACESCLYRFRFKNSLLTVPSGLPSLCIQLKAHKTFHDLGLSILHGEIRSLEVKVPWTALLSSPVKILIDGISLQVGPLDPAELDKKDTSAQILESKIEQLNIADQLIDFSGLNNDLKDINKGKNSEPATPSPTNSKATYVQQWTSKILDNIEITLKNVHIRYEDSQTIPGSSFSAGITLNSFTLSTCDEKWQEKFVERDIKSLASIRKLTKLSNFGLYWTTKSVTLREKSFDSWSLQMRSLIYSGINHADTIHEEIQYILHPENTLLIKLIHDKQSKKSGAIFDLSVESTNFSLSFDRSQYLQLMRTVDNIQVLMKKPAPLLYRPSERPTHSSESCRAWWKYAFKMASKRSQYIRLVKKSKTFDESGHMDIRSAEEELLQRGIETLLPLRTLVIFRHAAAKELIIEHSKNEVAQGRKITSQKQVQNEPRTWLGWMKSSKTSNSSIERQLSEQGEEGDGEGDLSIESIVSSLEHKESYEDSGESTQYKLHLTTSASLNLLVNKEPVIYATAALSVQAEQTPQGLSATVYMRDLLVEDMCTPTPAIKNIIAVKDTRGAKSISHTSAALDKEVKKDMKEAALTKTSDPSFSVVYNTYNNKKSVKITALPVEITINKLCIQKLAGLFQPSPSDSACTPLYPSSPSSSSPVRNLTLDTDKNMEENNEESNFLSIKSEDDSGIKEDVKKVGSGSGDSGVIEIIFEAHAPKIIIPEDSSSDKGYFLLDTGYLAVKVSVCLNLSFIIFIVIS